MSRKEIASDFLKLVSSGKVQEGYDRHVHEDFIHHNAYFKGNRQSLLAGMEENARLFPGKTYEVLRMLEDGDLAVIHGKVNLSPTQVFSVIHIFRFQEERIIEMWEASQQDLPDSPNEFGIF